MCAKILIVDDEPPIIDVLEYNLRRSNHTVITARDGAEAIEQARRAQPDLVILDLLLPVVDGLDVFRTLRSERNVPVIMLTAKDAEIDRVVGLELGADDYVVKPFSVRELMARVQNVLRRAAAKPLPAEHSRLIEVGQLRIDPVRHEVTWDGALLELTALEFDVLYALASHAGQVLSRGQLLERVWGFDYLGDGRAVDAVIKRLRARLREVGPAHDTIVTVRGVGYKLADKV